MIRSSVVCALAFAALAATAASATAQTRVQAGILQCRGAPTASFIVGSVHELGCVFQSDRGPRYRYYGVVRRVGLDIGFTEQSALAWAVFAPPPPLTMTSASIAFEAETPTARRSLR